MTIMRGDALTLYLALKQGSEVLTPADLADLEITIGPQGLRRTYLEGDVGYDEELEQWYLRLSQEDTFALEGSRCAVVARAKFANGPEFDVRGMKVGILEITDTLSQEVL